MGTLFDLTASHIGQGGIAGGYEPQRLNNFVFEVTPPDADASAQEILQLSVNAAFAVSENNEEIAVNHLNETVYIAGRAVWEAGELVLKDFVDTQTASIINDWRRKVYNPTNGRIGMAKDYKVDASIMLYGPDGNYERQWDLKGCWPQSVTWGAGWDATASDINTITVNIRYDKGYPVRLAGSLAGGITA